MPKIAVGPLNTPFDQYVYVVWEDYRDTADYYPEIFFNISPDNGVTWMGEQKITTCTFACYFASLAVDADGDVHIVYTESMDANKSNTVVKYLKWEHTL